MSCRFLLKFSYIGSRYRGVQRQTARSPDLLDQTSVQAVLERAIDISIKLPHAAQLVLSSRTDKHVHAHMNFAHVDLTPYPGHSIAAQRITHAVNRYLRKVEHDIVLRHTFLVPHWFHCRAEAHRRKYVYRVGILKEPFNRPSDTNIFPILNHQRCLLLQAPVDIETVHQACELLEGFHDYTAFQNVTKVQRPPKKHVEEFTFVPDHDGRTWCEYNECFNWWKFNVVAQSFLYRQVRRMVSAVLAAAQGRITLEKV